MLLDVNIISNFFLKVKFGLGIRIMVELSSLTSSSAPLQLCLAKFIADDILRHICTTKRKMYILKI